MCTPELIRSSPLTIRRDSHKAQGKVWPMNASELYNEGYFMRGEGSNYVNYSWKPELTLPMARSLVDLLNIKPCDSIMDIGCARGYVCKALRELGIDAWGFDISSWAIANCDPSVKDYVSQTFPITPYDFFLCKDVLEHISVPELSKMVASLAALVRKSILIIVPLSHVAGGPFVRREDSRDETHIIQWPLESWMSFITSLVDTDTFIVSGSWHWPRIKPSSNSPLKSCGFLHIKKIA